MRLSEWLWLSWIRWILKNWFTKTRSWRSWKSKRLVFFSSINYIIWIICDMHYIILKNAFKLKNHNIRRILIDRMNKIWKKRWNIANVKRKHFNWFNWSYAHRIWIIVFLFVTRFDFCRSHLIVLNDCFD
jgi:hypothetical protein